MKTQSRRSFLKTATLATATAVWSARSWSRVIGANGDAHVAVVGLNGRGRNHLTSLRAAPGVRLAAICDVDTAVLDRVAAELAKDGLTPENSPMCARCWLRRTWMPSRLPRRTTGTPSWASGRVRRARTPTWRSRCRTTSGKAASSPPP